MSALKNTVIGLSFLTAVSAVCGYLYFSKDDAPAKKAPSPAPAVEQKGTMPSQNTVTKPVAAAKAETTKPVVQKSTSLPSDLKSLAGKLPSEIGLYENEAFKQRLQKFLPPEQVKMVLEDWKVPGARKPDIALQATDKGIQIGVIYQGYNAQGEKCAQANMATILLNNDGTGGAYIGKEVGGIKTIKVYSTSQPGSLFYSGSEFDPYGIPHRDVIEAHLEKKFITYEKFKKLQAAVKAYEQKIKQQKQNAAPRP